MIRRCNCLLRQSAALSRLISTSPVRLSIDEFFPDHVIKVCVIYNSYMRITKRGLLFGRPEPLQPLKIAKWGKLIWKMERN